MRMQDVKKISVSSLGESLVRNVPSVLESSTLANTSSELVNSPFKVVAVIDTNQTLKGIVSSTDIAKKTAQQEVKPTQTTAADVMNPDYVSVLSKDTVESVLKTMIVKDLNYVFVKDDNGRLVGIIDRNKLADEIDRRTVLELK